MLKLEDPRDLPALFFLRAAQSLPLVAVVVAKQFPHPQLNLTELVLLALVLLPDGTMSSLCGYDCSEMMSL
ncbi:hypothetical protein [Xenorhabdus bovienii]|uniref:Uncharacterized protein n=1 Tax=Xenorhabdus bovienii str. kraussei Becker Underwood TaxID=1398204 RepID=A0A077PUU3_XENBV|nr:hypothetical protein [Xenorhabdus bovienii]CDH24793.1 hypothetical protein XBKB1_3110001 [Xenorhabdus bovienii str. kraussei Becker Underwood]